MKHFISIVLTILCTNGTVFGVSDQASNDLSLEFFHNNHKISELPINIASFISPIFKAQLEINLDDDKYHIDVDDFAPETVMLFTRLALIKFTQTYTNTLSDAQQKSFLQKNKYFSSCDALIAAHPEYLLDLYYFLDKYRVDQLIPCIALPLIKQIALNRELLTSTISPFINSSTLQKLASSLSSLYIPILFQDQKNIVELGNKLSIKQAIVTPDARRRATIESNNSIRIYNVDYKQEIGRIDTKGKIQFITFSPDGNFLASVFTNNRIHIYNLIDKVLFADIQIHSQEVPVIAFSKNSKYFAVSGEQKVDIYNLIEETKIGSIAHGNIINTLSFSQDSAYLCTGSDDNTARIYDLAQKKVIQGIVHKDSVTFAQFSPNARYLATASLDNSVTLYDMSLFKIIAHIPCEKINSLVFSPNSEYLGIASKNDGILIHNLFTQKTEIIDSNISTESIVFSPDSRLLVAVYEDADAYIYHVTNRKKIGTVYRAAENLTPVFNNTSHLLAIPQIDNTIQIYQTIPALNKLGTLKSTHPIRTLFFSPNSQSLITISTDKIIDFSFADITTLPTKQLITTALIIEIVNSLNKHERVRSLDATSWLYKEFMLLKPAQQKQLYEIYPALQKLIPANNPLMLPEEQKSWNIKNWLKSLIE